MIDAAAEELDLLREESGFSWHPIPKRELQLVSFLPDRRQSGRAPP